jgi:hypothetical protein
MRLFLGNAVPAQRLYEEEENNRYGTRRIKRLIPEEK